ncbi:MAG: transcriptional regulator [Chthonomonadaceae bacterium]|jgi:predicted transcriptional regulator|nr:transcriptional regulator [Chthonomonadaceae bacterium]
MRSSPPISKAELKLLSYINDHHPITVREVADHFAESDAYARTTVQTLMERLRSKGHLVREQIDGLQRYAPAVPKESMQQSLVRDFVSRALGGSVSPFVAFLTREARVSDAELDDLKRLVAELEKQRKEE